MQRRTRWEDGRQLTREDIQKVLKKAAAAVGLPAERFMTHSLRVGGASALYHAVNDVEIVKRWGRWSSTAFHRYLWEPQRTGEGAREPHGSGRGLDPLHMTVR